MYSKLRRFSRRLQASRRIHTRRLWIWGRHPFMIPIVVFIFLVIASVTTLWWFTSRGASLTPNATDIVIISYDHHTRTVPSHEPTVKALLSKLQITLNQGDVVEPNLNTTINQDDFRINIYRAAPVKIIEGSTITFGYSAATTPRSVAKQAGIDVYSEDQLTYEPVTNFLEEKAVGNIIAINRSTPVTLSVNGFAAATRTRAKTVGQFLSEKNVAVNKNTTVQPTVESPIVANAVISVIRDGTGIQSSSQAIAMPVQYINDDSLAYGTFAVRQAGSPGEQVSTYRVVVQSGKVVSSTLLQTIVTVQAITQIEARGTNLSGVRGDMSRAGISPDDFQYADYIISRESGWCPTKAQGQWGGCPAYTGNVPSYGGYGLCQATPGSKMSSAGADWATNPITQLHWCSGYAHSRYGSWYNAYNHWLASHNW